MIRSVLSLLLGVTLASFHPAEESANVSNVQPRQARRTAPDPWPGFSGKLVEIRPLREDDEAIRVGNEPKTLVVIDVFGFHDRGDAEFDAGETVAFAISDEHNLANFERYLGKYVTYLLFGRAGQWTYLQPWGC